MSNELFRFQTGDIVLRSHIAGRVVYVFYDRALGEDSAVVSWDVDENPYFLKGFITDAPFSSLRLIKRTHPDGTIEYGDV